MKALFLSAPQEFEYRDTDFPVQPEGWVRVRMRRVGICGSDVHYYMNGRIGDQVVAYPHILGHEGCGEILDGAGEFERGQPVYIEPAIHCGECDQCLAGRENTCRMLTFLGNPGENSGCMCEEMVMPAKCIVPLPEWMDLDDAVLLEPLCIGCYSVLRSRATKGCSAAIVGAGPIGLTVAVGLNELEPSEVYVSEPVAARRKAAERLGATRTFDPGEEGAGEGAGAAVQEASHGGVDVVFECAGTQESIDDAATMLKPGGTLVLVGIPADLDRISCDLHWLRRCEATIVNIRRQNRAISHALAALERQRHVRDVFITHHFTPDRAKEAFDLVRRRADNVIKAVLHF